MGSHEGHYLREAAASLIRRAGIEDDFTIEELPRGANNRLFRIDTKNRSVLLKEYFHHPSDPRDRLSAEFTFSSFAWRSGLRNLPQPLASDPEHHLGLYEFVEGRPFADEDVTKEAVEAAVRFFVELNSHRGVTAAQQIAPGSEACFSFDAHAVLIRRRVETLAGIDPITPLDREAKDFARNALAPALERIEGTAWELTKDQWCLSPSDFGFHNALLSSPDNRIVFLDFEYAGWDDPARMVCDFFCQPARPVAKSLFPSFAASVSSVANNDEGFYRRIELLFPLYQIKWCSIMLNDFLPAGNLRRRFAAGAANAIERKQRQLAKAIANLPVL